MSVDANRADLRDLWSTMKTLDNRLLAARRDLAEQTARSREAIMASRELMKRADELIGDKAS
jgi:hypothetical protein